MIFLIIIFEEKFKRNEIKNFSKKDNSSMRVRKLTGLISSNSEMELPKIMILIY